MSERIDNFTWAFETVSKFVGDELSDGEICQNETERTVGLEMESKFAGDNLSSDKTYEHEYTRVEGETESKFVGEDSSQDEKSSEVTIDKDEDNTLPNDHFKRWREDMTETISEAECALDIDSDVANKRMADELKWRQILSSLGLKKEAHEFAPNDVIGKVFKSLEDAGFFFNHYASLIGFSVRKGHMRRRKNGILMLREWKCSREGTRHEKFLKMINRRREARPITRVGCQVQFRVVHLPDNTEWICKEFIVGHNHDLVDARHIQFLRSNRIIPGGDLQLARSMRRAGIRTCHIMSFLAQQSGGYENMRYIIKDLYNNIRESDGIHLSDSDASRAIGYLEHKMDHDEGFFGKYSFDDEGRLGNIVWADSRCQSDYSCFGHAIAFDTTYRTNGYHKPLLIWIGVNQHFKTTVLGFGILVDESVETYLWVTKAFIECMDGVTPKTVVTDGDPAIRAAVAKLLPNATHRLCSWHIQRNAVTNVKDSNFLSRMKKMIHRYYSNEMFDKEWFRIIDDFGLHSNVWMKIMYERRRSWAETFLRGQFFVGMSTTQRSEGINALLKKKLSDKLNLFEFVRSIDLALSSLRHNEEKDEFDTNNSQPMLNQTNMKEIECQAAKVYSRAIFFKVRDEIMKEGKYIVTKKDSDNEGIYYELTKYGEKECKRIVQYIMEKNYYQCGCNYFPSFGIPCRHVFATLKYRHVTTIPESMIVSQWTMDSKKKYLKESSYAPTCCYTSSEEAARFGVVQNCSRDIAFVAGKSRQLCELAVSQMAKVHHLLIKEMDTNFQTCSQKRKSIKNTVQIRNPLCAKTKGTSSRKTGPGGGKRKCSQCSRYGHNKTTCKNKKANNDENFHDTMEVDEEDVNKEHVNDEYVNIAHDGNPWSLTEEELPVVTNCRQRKEAHDFTAVGPPSQSIMNTFTQQPSLAEEKCDLFLFDTVLTNDEYEKWWGKPFDN